MFDQQRHWIERAWWIVAIAASAIACFVSIYSVWAKWQQYPIIIDTEPELRPIYEIPFPAVTICSYTATVAHKFNYTAAYRSLYKLDGNDSRDLTAYELKVMKFLSQFCFEGIYDDITGPIHDNYLDDDFWNTIIGLAPTFEETFVHCKIFGHWVDCHDYFFPQLTERGICYTFNSLNIQEMYTNEVSIDMRNMTSTNRTSNWKQQSGYSQTLQQKRSNPNTYPFFTYGNSLRSSLTVVLKAKKADLDFLCSGGPQGFLVSLHAPNERPEMFKRYYYVPLQQSVLFRVDPLISETDERIHTYDVEKRRCYRTSERHLYFYKRYTSQNCRMECLSNATKARCGCVRYNMLRSNGTKICGPGKFNCYKEIDRVDFREKALESCKCYWPCKHSQYKNIQTSQAVYFFYKRNDSRPTFKQQLNIESDEMYTRLIVKFKDDKVVVFKFVEALTLTKFYTKVGGIFSLFVGASLISFIELLYYATLRLIFSTNQSNSD